MGFWDWLSGTRSRVELTPRWASGFADGERFDAWAALVLDALDERGWPADRARVRSGSVMVEHGGHRMELMLHDLASCCSEADSERWPQLVANALDGEVLSPPGAKKKKTKKKRRPASPTGVPVDEIVVGDVRLDIAHGPFETVAPLLTVQLFSRLGRTPYVDLLDRESLVLRELADGLVAVLVLDLGTHERTVPAEHLERWGVSADAAFERGLDNLLAHPFEIQTLGDLGAYLVIGNGSFIASLALRLDALCTLAGIENGADDGWVVAVPNWHALLFAPPDAAASNPDALIALAAQLHDYADAVSPDLFVVDREGWRRTNG